MIKYRIAGRSIFSFVKRGGWTRYRWDRFQIQAIQGATAFDSANNGTITMTMDLQAMLDSFVKKRRYPRQGSSLVLALGQHNVESHLLLNLNRSNDCQVYFFPFLSSTCHHLKRLVEENLQILHAVPVASYSSCRVDRNRTYPANIEQKRKYHPDKVHWGEPYWQCCCEKFPPQGSHVVHNSHVDAGVDMFDFDCHGGPQLKNGEK